MIVLSRDGRREVVVKRNNVLLASRVILLVALWIMLFASFTEICFSEDAFLRVVGIVAISFWTLTDAIMMYLVLSEHYSTYVLSESGVLVTSPFRKKGIAWSEIADYGLSFVAKNKYGHALFNLYFSPTVLGVKRGCAKKLDRRTLKIHIMLAYFERDRAVAEKIFSFAGEYTSAEPFIPEDLKTENSARQ